MDDCIFCKIAKGEAPAYKIYEDDEFMAFLDIFPANKGQSLVIPKAHTISQFSKIDKELMRKAINVAQAVSEKLENAIENVNRCVIAIEGFDVAHFHIKVYPTFEPDPTKDAFGRGGGRADDKVLKFLQDKINEV